MSIPADERAQAARQILVDLLKENGPQLGAKLKVRLTTVLGQRLGLPANTWHALLPKLSHFLAAHSDLVDVDRPEGPGDIRVSLRDSASSPSQIERQSTKVKRVYTVTAGGLRTARNLHHVRERIWNAIAEGGRS